MKYKRSRRKTQRRGTESILRRRLTWTFFSPHVRKRKAIILNAKTQKKYNNSMIDDSCVCLCVDKKQTDEKIML